MHDAGLNRRFGEGRGDRLGEALQSLHDGNQDVLEPARLRRSFITDSQNLAPSLSAIQRPRTSRTPSRGTPKAM
jgi:hypothetical protein